MKYEPPQHNGFDLPLHPLLHAYRKQELHNERNELLLILRVHMPCSQRDEALQIANEKQSTWDIQNSDHPTHCETMKYESPQHNGFDPPLHPLLQAYR